MKRRQTLFPALILFVFSAPVFAQTPLANWLIDMKEVHPVFRRAALEREIADLTRTKGLIEASTEEQRLNVEIVFISSLASINQQLISFYTDIADAAFTVALETVDLDIAGIQEKIAADSYALAEVQYRQGIVSAEEVEEKLIAAAEARRNVLLAEETKTDAESYFTYTTGQNWDPGIIELFSLFSWLPDHEEWHRADFDLRKARFQSSLVGYRLENLPKNAPPGNRRLQEIEVEKARLSAEAARFSADRQFARTILDLKSELQTAELLFSKEKLERQQSETAANQFNRGLLSEQAYDQQRVRFLQAKKNRLTASLEYISTLFDTIVTAGFLPEDVLL